MRVIAQNTRYITAWAAWEKHGRSTGEARPVRPTPPLSTRQCRGRRTFNVARGAGQAQLGKPAVDVRGRGSRIVPGAGWRRRGVGGERVHLGEANRRRQRLPRRQLRSPLVCVATDGRHGAEVGPKQPGPVEVRRRVRLAAVGVHSVDGRRLDVHHHAVASGAHAAGRELSRLCALGPGRRSPEPHGGTGRARGRGEVVARAHGGVVQVRELHRDRDAAAAARHGDEIRAPQVLCRHARPGSGRPRRALDAAVAVDAGPARGAAAQPSTRG